MVNRYFKLYRVRIHIPDNAKIRYNKDGDFYIINCPSAEKTLVKGSASTGEILLYLKMLMPF
jgi:hypothetical protein